MKSYFYYLDGEIQIKDNVLRIEKYRDKKMSTYVYIIVDEDINLNDSIYYFLDSRYNNLIMAKNKFYRYLKKNKIKYKIKIVKKEY